MSALAPLTDIPLDIMAAAMRALMVPEHDMVDSVARAILAERQAERERCAQQLEEMIARRRIEFPRRYLANAYIQACASAIRRGPSPISKANPLSARGFSNAEQATEACLLPASVAANSPAMAHEVRSASTDAPETQGKQCTSVVSKDEAGQNLAGNPIHHSLPPPNPPLKAADKPADAQPLGRPSAGEPITHRNNVGAK